jgi:tRNA C32,U32 (ribose-2'-O)-methylase TrmJ
MSLDNCRVVLVGPEYGGNVGATARVMHNFGLKRLVLVAPKADPLGRDARRMSTHGEFILRRARTVDDLGEAVGDCGVVVGTSASTAGLFRGQSAGPPEAIMPLERLRVHVDAG